MAKQLKLSTLGTWSAEVILTSELPKGIQGHLDRPFPAVVESCNLEMASHSPSGQTSELPTRTRKCL